MRNNRLEKAGEMAAAATSATPTKANAGNSSALFDFLNNNRIAAASRLSPEDLDSQISDEREAWE